MKKLNDFGQKIGGAKKDIWAMLHDMDESERSKMARKSKLWKRPDYQFMVNRGAEKEACFWQDKMRESVKPRAKAGMEEDYIRFVIYFKEAVEACATLADVETFYKKSIQEYLVNTEGTREWRYAKPQYAGFLNGNQVLRYVYSKKRLLADCEAEHFLEPDEDKEARKYKVLEATAENTTVTPPHASEPRFQTTIKTDGSIYTFWDGKDYRPALANGNTGYFVCYEERKLGFFTEKADALKAIAAEKAKQKEKKEAAKKESFLPPHLSEIKRTGSDYKYFRLTDGNILLARYGLRGGEFGNYTTAKDRLGSLNMAYDAFQDLYEAIGITAKDISLGGKLAIAFGARGRGCAMAHYEPAKNVINMTKLRGAGSLAHEWAHAMDWYLGQKFGTHGFASESLRSSCLPDSISRLVEAMKVQDGKETKFFRSSKDFDGEYKKAGNGYWASNREMFARAFACYVHDKLGEKQSDYLVGHAECAISSVGCAIPAGAERMRLNQLFDSFFADMVTRGVFTRPEAKKEETKKDGTVTEIVFFESANGQMMFC